MYTIFSQDMRTYVIPRVKDESVSNPFDDELRNVELL